MDGQSGSSYNDSITFSGSMEKVQSLVNKQDVHQMIKLQEATLNRLECTNKSLEDCNTMAQNKMTATSKLYKRTAKQISESKKDLDVIYRKILDMKARIKLERPELFVAERTGTDTDKSKSHSIGEQANKTDETSEAPIS